MHMWLRVDPARMTAQMDLCPLAQRRPVNLVLFLVLSPELYLAMMALRRRELQLARVALTSRSPVIPESTVQQRLRLHRAVVGKAKAVETIASTPF